MNTLLRLVAFSLLVLGILVPGASVAQARPDSPVSYSTQSGGLGPEYQLSVPSSPETDRYAPASAYNSALRQTLVVWNRHGGSNYYIEGRLLDANGKPLGSLPTILVSGATPVYQPAVAYDATLNRYLLVWMRNTLLDGKTYAIWAKLLNANLTEARPEYLVINPTTNMSLWSPRAAWNSSRDEFMIVWNVFDNTSYPNIFPIALAQASLYEDGDVIPNPMTIIYNTVDNLIYPQEVDLVFFASGDPYGKYMWVWKQIKPGTYQYDIWAANIDAQLGGITPGLPPWKVEDSTVEQAHPRIATTGANDFMVVWQERYSTDPQDWDIHGREMNQIGTFFGGTHVIAGTSADETAPFIAAWPGAVPRYVVGYESESATGQGIGLGFYDNGANTVSILGFIFWLDIFPVADYGFWYNSMPTGLVSPPRVQIAYQGVSNTPNDHPHIYSRAWTPYRTPLPLLKR